MGIMKELFLLTLVLLSSSANVDADEYSDLISGKVGCLFEGENFCQPREECFDDALFGTCVSDSTEELYVYDNLSNQQLLEIEIIVDELISREATWADFLVQCKVKRLLESFSGIGFADFEDCEDAQVEMNDIESSDWQAEPEAFEIPVLYDASDVSDGMRKRGEKELGWPKYSNGKDASANDGGVWNDADMKGVPKMQILEIADEEPVVFGGEELGPMYDMDPRKMKREQPVEEEFVVESNPFMSYIPVEVVSDEEVQFGDASNPVSGDTPLDYMNKKDTEKLIFGGSGAGLFPNYEDVAVTREKYPDAEQELISEFQYASDPDMENDPDFQLVDASYVYIDTNRVPTYNDIKALLGSLSMLLSTPPTAFSDLKIQDKHVTFRVSPFLDGTNASIVAKAISEPFLKQAVQENLNLIIKSTGIEVRPLPMVSHLKNGEITVDRLEPVDIPVDAGKRWKKLQIATWAVLACTGMAIVLAAVVYAGAMRYKRFKRMADMGIKDGEAGSSDYEALCRQRVDKNRSPTESISSFSEEPVAADMDIGTGHTILAYMEEMLKSKDRLAKEWESLSKYKPVPNKNEVGTKNGNSEKNRYSNILPYDHTRVPLSPRTNSTKSDYINANFITDSDPKCPMYIATQAPLANTVSDFWQLVWEQGSTTIVNLTQVKEGNTELCHPYWPKEGSEVYHIFEVHLVSEHRWCDEYIVRSFYLKNLNSNETRTVTQFHYKAWPHLKTPASAASLLEFRRKVNKSYAGRSRPVIVHCSDGADRTGSFILLDMALTRLTKGVKQIDVAATLEHIRDQRMQMVRTKEQFEFVLGAIAHEVEAILKALQ